MAQLNLYVPDEFAEQLRTDAKREGKSLSSFVVELLEESVRKSTFDWDAHFAKLDAHGPVKIELTEQDRHFGELRDIDLG